MPKSHRRTSSTYPRRPPGGSSLDRRVMLTQLTTLRRLLPRWVCSRWLLEEALRDQSSATRAAAAEATAASLELCGGGSEALRGNWVYRQAYLYDFGGLETFLAEAAEPAVVDEADRIDLWVKAPMSGYRLEEHAPATTTWTDLASGARVVVPALGCGVLMTPGDHAIGRLVRVDAGQLFETAPLPVPERVARRVTDRPGDWLSALRAGLQPGHRVSTGPFGLIADVPETAMTRAVFPGVDWGAGYRDGAVVAALTSTAQRALAELAGFRVASGTPPPWPCLAAAVVDPVTLAAFAKAPGAADRAVLEQLGVLLAEPAAAVCRSLARTLCAAA